GRDPTLIRARRAGAYDRPLRSVKGKRDTLTQAGDPGSLRSSKADTSNSPQRRRDALVRALRLGVGEHERRRQADDRVAMQRPVEDETAFERAPREARAGGGVGELEADQETEAARRGETAPSDEVTEALEQARAERGGAH